MTRLLASIPLLLALSVAAAAQPDRGNGGRAPFIPPKDANFDLFRGLLHFYGVKPVTPDDLDGTPNGGFGKVIVVVLGASDDRGTRGVEAYTRKAMRNGGAVLIATDRACDLLPYFTDRPAGRQLRVTGETVRPRTLDDCYARRPEFPFALPEPELNDALFAGRRRLATNLPSALVARNADAYLTYLAAQTTDENGNRRPFALAGVGVQRPVFRSMVLADPDVLSNQMLYSSGLPDGTGQKTDNWAFANDLVKDFLRGPTDRDKCLFIENGRVIDTFDKVELKSIQQMPTIPPIPLPDPLDRRVQAKLAEVIDGGLATLEDRTVADNLLAGPPNDPSPRRYQTTMTVLAAAAGVVLVVLMARRLLSARHRKKFVPAPSDPLFLGDDTALGSFGQRRAELLRGTDFRAAVAYGVRALFAAQGLPAGYGRRRLPPLQYRGRSDRERLGGDIRDLWDAAARDETASLSYAEWKDLEPVLAEVHAAAAADRWRFAPTSPQGSA